MRAFSLSVLSQVVEPLCPRLARNTVPIHVRSPSQDSIQRVLLSLMNSAVRSFSATANPHVLGPGLAGATAELYTPFRSNPRQKSAMEGGRKSVTAIVS